METTLPKRRPTRLRTYSYSNVGYYFITICAENKEKLFGNIVGGSALDAPMVQLTEIGKAIDDHVQSTNRIPGVVVDKYVIMPNHVHMIIEINETDDRIGNDRANEMVPHVIGTLKRLVNRKAGKNVFQLSYHDHVIRGERDYQKIWSYIDDNPRRWKDDCFFMD